MAIALRFSSIWCSFVAPNSTVDTFLFLAHHAIARHVTEVLSFSTMGMRSALVAPHALANHS